MKKAIFYISQVSIEPIPASLRPFLQEFINLKISSASARNSVTELPQKEAAYFDNNQDYNIAFKKATAIN